MMKKAVIFDFFGTLVSTPESLFASGGKRTWQLLKKYDYGIEFEAFKRKWEDCLNQMEEESNLNYTEFHFFDFVKAFLQKNFPNKSPTFSLVKQLAETFLWEWNQGVWFFDESKQVIRQLSINCRIGLISKTHYPDLVYRNLAKAGINDAFDAIITSVEFGIKKPDHRIFEHAAFRLCVKTGDCLYVGDNPREDYEGAMNAGMEALLIDRNGKFHDFTGNRINKLMELTFLLTKD
jgi:HAD superfamily hydrolase (TIGR01549 family)